MYYRDSATGQPREPLEVQLSGNGNISLQKRQRPRELQYLRRYNLPSTVSGLPVFIGLSSQVKQDGTSNHFYFFILKFVLICKDCGTVLYILQK